jgi:hypothetical protein
MGPAPRERDDDVDGDGDGDGLVDTTMRPAIGRAAGMGVGSPGTSPNRRAVRKTGSGMRGAAHERVASPNGSGNGITRGSTSTIRPFSRLSTSSTSRPRVGSTTETHASSARPNGTGRALNRPTNLSMSINTDRQQAKFAGRLRFPQGHGQGNGNGSEGRDSPISPTTPTSMTSGSARPATKIVAKTTTTATMKTTMTNNNTKAPSARPGVGPGGQAGVGRKERMEKGKALVLPKAPGGRI